jgi:DsbC/DsbD-like thiol-disulfide interchange protein
MLRRGNATRIPQCVAGGIAQRHGTARGVAIQLQPGWKTYWRTPGDSGVPPRFDFSKSDNIEAVTVLWPAPKKFDDGAGGTALGYKQQVVLPLRIVAKNTDKPVTLRASISYAVCDKLCIPSKPKPNSPLPAWQAPRTATCPMRSIRCRSPPISATPIR